MPRTPDDRDIDVGEEAFASIAHRLRAANERIEPPTGLTGRIDAAIRQDVFRRRVRRVAVGLAAAAVLALALTAWWWSDPALDAGPVAPGAGVAVNTASPPIAETPATDAPTEKPPVVRVEFDDDSPLFARRIESSRSNISIHMIYQGATSPPAPVGSEPDAMRAPTEQGATT